MLLLIVLMAAIIIYYNRRIKNIDDQLKRISWVKAVSGVPIAFGR
jgi:predicted ABC-type exoprotein transport system permease subunit